MQLPSSGHESRGRIDDIERTRSVFRVARTGRGGCRAPDWKEQEWLRLWGWWPSHHPWEAAPDQTGATDRGGYSEAENCRALVVLTG